MPMLEQINGNTDGQTDGWTPYRTVATSTYAGSANNPPPYWGGTNYEY